MYIFAAYKKSFQSGFSHFAFSKTGCNYFGLKSASLFRDLTVSLRLRAEFPAKPFVHRELLSHTQQHLFLTLECDLSVFSRALPVGLHCLFTGF